MRRIKGYNLFSCEAQFHPSCRKNYCTKVFTQNANTTAVSDEAEMRRSHTKAFLSVCTVVDERILCEMEVIKLNHMHEIYISELENMKYSNDNYKSGKLKAKLIKQYEGQLSFQALRLLTGIYESDLVYNSSTDVGKVVEQAYLLGMEDQTKNVALTLRTCVQRAYKDSTPLPWPPTARDLKNSDITLPKELKKFLEFLITGKRTEKISPQNSRLVESIGQDLCRAVTNGHWKMPKHILLSVTYCKLPDITF